MGRNQVQFQKRLSLTSFLAKYGNEEKCHESLFKFRWPKGFVGPKYGGDRYCHIQSRKVLQCYLCRTQTSLISGTIFLATKLPLTIWFLTIHLYLMMHTGAGKSKMVSEEEALQGKQLFLHQYL
jgi:hypothetical protein